MATKPPNTSLLDAKHQFASDTTPAPLAHQSSGITFVFQGVQPPSILYVDVDDVLVVQCATSQTNEVVTVNVRLLLPNGRIEDMQFKVAPVNTRIVLIKSFALAQGYILSASATAAVAITRGQTFVRVYTQRSASGAGSPAQMLLADYVTTLTASVYPNGRVLSPTEGVGFIYPFVVANPPAGVDWTQAVPSNARWRVRSWSAVLTTAVAVANRNVQAQVFSVGNIEWVSGALASIAASTAARISAGGIVPYTSVIATDFMLDLPPDLVLAGTAGFVQSLGVVTQNIQAADQWSAIVLLIEEWLDNV